VGGEIIEMEVKERILRDSIVDGIMSLIVSNKETRETSNCSSD